MNVLTINRKRIWQGALAGALLISGYATYSQDTTDIQKASEPEVADTKLAKAKIVKNTFESVWIIDNQTVMVPVKKTFEMDIMHRFGTVGKGYQDFWGLFAPSNIRMGFSYSPLNRLNVGIGITKNNMLWDGNLKYSIISQSKGKGGYPLSVTYYGNVAVDTRKDGELGLFDQLFQKTKLTGGEGLFTYSTDRFSYFHQLIIARKINDKLSVQIAPGVAHQNSVYGYYKQVDSATKVVAKEMKNDHFAIAFSGRYKLTEVTSFLLNVDQPVTRHTTSNPDPNISFGLEFSTGSHAFQVFMGNYSSLSPQRNNLYNRNNYKNADGNVSLREFLIGFNITRLWNY